MNVSVVRAARRMLGIPYRFGCASPEAVDCAGFIWRVRVLCGLPSIPQPRYAEPIEPQSFAPLFRVAHPVPSPEPGDVVILEDCGRAHLGILGFGEVIHASRAAGAVIADPIAKVRLRSAYRLRTGAHGR